VNKLFFLLLVGGLVGSYVLLTQPIPQGTTSQPAVEAPATGVTPEPIIAPANTPAAEPIVQPAPAPTTEPVIEFAPVPAGENTGQTTNSQPSPIELSPGEPAPMPTIELPVAETEMLQTLPDTPAAPGAGLMEAPPLQGPADATAEPPSMPGYAPIEPVFQPAAGETPEAVFRDPNDLYQPEFAPEQPLPVPLPAD
jgi:hypothetical protein